MKESKVILFIVFMIFAAGRCGSTENPPELLPLTASPSEIKMSGGTCSTTVTAVNTSSFDMQLLQTAVLTSTSSDTVRSYDTDETTALFGSMLVPAGTTADASISFTPTTAGEFIIRVTAVSTTGTASFFVGNVTCEP